MGRLIDVDVAIMAAVEYIEDWNHVQSMYHRRKLTEKFMALPTVDAVPVKHGQWKEDTGGYGFWICSHCGFVSEASAANLLYRYCPHCGVRMDGKGNGNEKTD